MSRRGRSLTYQRGSTGAKGSGEVSASVRVKEPGKPASTVAARGKRSNPIVRVILGAYNSVRKMIRNRGGK